MTDRLFDIDEVPEVPLFREPPPGRGAQIMDERIEHDYPPEWHRCTTCGGSGSTLDALRPEPLPDAKGNCPDCLGMGSAKAMARLLAGHRCERCRHPYMPKGDARMLGAESSWKDGCGGWTTCDDECQHGGAVAVRNTDTGEIMELGPMYEGATVQYGRRKLAAENLSYSWEAVAPWLILTVHHLDGDKANLAWWNLAALCQRCHLHIQGKVVMERVYPHEHSEWFKPHAAGWYAKTYLGEDVSREEALARMGELLALERA